MEGAFPTRPGNRTGRRGSLGTWLLAALLPAALATAGCSHNYIDLAATPWATNYWGTTAASHLKHVRQNPDANVRFIAYSKLADLSCYDTEQQKVEAVKTLLTKLEKGGEPVATRAVIIRTLGALGNPSARDAIVKAVDDPEAVIRVQACRALGKVGKPEDATILARKMTVDTLEDCRIAAIDAIGELKPSDSRIPQFLVAGMQHDDPATRLASLNALRKITGRDLGVDAGPWQKMLQPDKSSRPETLIASPTPPPSTNPAPTSKPDSDPQAKTAAYPTTNPNLNPPRPAP